MEAALQAWMEANRETVRNSSLHIKKMEDDGVELQINGKMLQLMVPSTLVKLLRGERGGDPDEFFIVLSPDDTLDNDIARLNEKLERVKVNGANALGKVLDEIVNAFGVSKPKLKEAAAISTVGNGFRMRAVMREYHNICRAISEAEDPDFLMGVKIGLPDETEISLWEVHMTKNMFKDTPLYKDLMQYARNRKLEQESASILLEFKFPADYPFAPPFVRVVRPRFKFHTGHVTIGGSICMEVLTEAGWLPSFSLESVLVQIHHALVEGCGRLAVNDARDYSEADAHQAFIRVALDHGWMK
eukprot:Gb_05625 [translate_table: standard]